MEKTKKVSVPAYIRLMIVAAVMSFAIAGVYMLTKDTIAEAAEQAQAEARNAVMPGAAYMEELPVADDADVDSCFAAYDSSGQVMGYVSQITVIGFGGEIEVTVGMDMSASVTAVSVGGADFSETSGLGAKTREPSFTDQFKGASGILVLKQNIDSVSGASVSSGAVVSGVNKALNYMKALLPEQPASAVSEPLVLTAEQIAVLLPGESSAQWMGSVSGIDGWWKAENGYIVRAAGFGEGPITVTMGFTDQGVVQGIIIGDELFMESEGRGDRILEEWFGAQFVGRTGAQSYGDEISAISGATVTSSAVLSAINACMTFDPADPESSVQLSDDIPSAEAADAVTEASVPEEASNEAVSASGEASVDAVTEASVSEADTAADVITAAAEAPVPDAVTEASIPEEEQPHELISIMIASYTPEVDAVSEASIPEEEPEPTPSPIPEPDAVTEASVPEE